MTSAAQLVAAQSGYRRAVEERRAAVLAAREEHGWSVYRIAKTLQVDESTVRAILRAALTRR